MESERYVNNNQNKFSFALPQSRILDPYYSLNWDLQIQHLRGDQSGNFLDMQLYNTNSAVWVDSDSSVKFASGTQVIEKELTPLYEMRHYCLLCKG